MPANDEPDPCCDRRHCGGDAGELDVSDRDRGRDPAEVPHAELAPDPHRRHRFGKRRARRKDGAHERQARQVELPEVGCREAEVRRAELAGMVEAHGEEPDGSRSGEGKPGGQHVPRSPRQHGQDEQRRGDHCRSGRPEHLHLRGGDGEQADRHQPAPGEAVHRCSQRREREGGPRHGQADVGITDRRSLRDDRRQADERGACESQHVVTDELADEEERDQDEQSTEQSRSEPDGVQPARRGVQARKAVERDEDRVVQRRIRRFVQCPGCVLREVGRLGWQCAAQRRCERPIRRVVPELPERRVPP